MKTVEIEITSAVVIDGKIRPRGSVLSVDETVAKDLLAREKVVLATDEESPEIEAAEPEADATDMAQEPDADEGSKGGKRK